MTVVYLRLARVERPRAGLAPRGPLGALGLHRSRGAVLQLAGLQAVDALAGGFIMQSLLAYWFHLRYGVGPGALGMLFFGTNLLSALSFSGATMSVAATGLPFFLSGGLKIVYDLALFFRFRRVPLPEEGPPPVRGRA